MNDFDDIFRKDCTELLKKKRLQDMENKLTVVLDKKCIQYTTKKNLLLLKTKYEELNNIFHLQRGQ